MTTVVALANLATRRDKRPYACRQLRQNGADVVVVDAVVADGQPTDARANPAIARATIDNTLAKMSRLTSIRIVAGVAR